MSRPLLPVIRGANDFPAIQNAPEEGGLFPIKKEDLEGRLYRLSEICTSGIPSLFAHPFAYSCSLKDQTKTDEWFKLLIKGIFLGAIEPEEIAVSDLGSLGEVANMFYPGLRNILILKWNRELIGGSYPECLVFPGIRVTPEQSKALRLEIEGLEKKYNKAAGVFAKWVQEVEASMGLKPDGEAPLLWLKQLRHLRNEWKGPGEGHLIEVARVHSVNPKGALEELSVKRYVDHIISCDRGHNLSEKTQTLALVSDRRIKCPDCKTEGIGPSIDEKGFFELAPGQYVIWDIPNISLPRGCTKVTILDGRQAIFHFGNLRVLIQGQVLSMKDLLCRKTIRFENNKLPDLPIKGEHLPCVLSCEFKGDSWAMRLKGVEGTISVPIPESISGDRASILLWPDFVTKGWKINYVFFYGTDSFLNLGPALRLIDYQEGYTQIKELGKLMDPPSGMKVDSAVNHVEIICGGEQVGIFKDIRPAKEPQDGRAFSQELSVDFGTSNTCFSVWQEKEQEPKVLAVKDCTKDILGNDFFSAMIRKQSWWLPTYSNNPNEKMDSFPSELIFSQRDLRRQGSLNDPIGKFTIPHPAFERSKAEMDMVSNFKWGFASRAHPFHMAEEKVIRAYLKMLLHLVLAHLKKENRNLSRVNLVASFPLAFGFGKHQSYKSLLESLCEEGKEIELETGVRMGIIADHRKDLVSESHAGKASFERPGFELTVDIGGGTTDLALANKDHILAVDSIRYAGNTYLSVLAEKYFPQQIRMEEIEETEDKERVREAKLILLQRIIRQEGIKGVISRYDDSGKKAQKILIYFFEGLFEYIYRILKANEVVGNITFYPLGNGWGFVAGLGAQGVRDVAAYIQDWFGRREIDVDVIIPGHSKGAVSMGAMKIKENYQAPDLTHPVISVVGGEISVSFSGRNERWSENKKVPKETVTTSHHIRELRIDSSAFVASLPWEGIREKKNYFSSRLNSECLNYFKPYQGKTELSLTSSIFSIFLEKIYPDFLQEVE